jgi:hypothetical protein
MAYLGTLNVKVPSTLQCLDLEFKMGFSVTHLLVVLAIVMVVFGPNHSDNL